MADSPDKSTHAQRRRAEAQEGARIKLRAGQFVRRLREIADKVETVEPAKVPALRLKADIYCKLLSKCLPDLKAVEHTGETRHVHVSELSDEDIAARLSNLERARVTDRIAGKAAGKKKPAGVH